jgi:Mannosyltransferase (PIG-V)
MSIAPAPASSGSQLAGQLGRAGGALRRWAEEWRAPFLVWAWSRLLTLLAVAMVGWVERPRGSGDLVAALITPLRSWDGFWYLSIAQYGYDPTIAHGNSPAFFPLYPLTLSAAEQLLPFSYAVTGVILSNLLFLPALMVLYRLTRDRFGDVIAKRTITYLAISPLSFVFSMVYTESLALLLICTTFLLLEKRRIWGASAVGALASLARPVGILLAPAIAWQIFHNAGRRVSWRLLWQLLPVLLLPLAVIGFQAYLWWRTGEVYATHSAEERGWSRGAEPLYILLVPVAVVHAVWIAFFDNHDLGLAVSAVAVCTYFWLIAALVRTRKAPMAYCIFAIGCVVLPAYTGTWLGFPRFGLVIFPLFWMLALWGENVRFDNAVRMLFPALMVGFAFVSFGVGTFTP